jgi:periplasmic protein TonB
MYRLSSFTQQLTPPPPPDLQRDKSAVTVPVIKPGTKFGQGIKDLFNMADLDQQPQLRVPVQPNYPADLKRQGIEGSCTVEFIVDSNGKVVQAQVISATQREFENPSMQAVLKWQFRPGKKGGRAVNTRCQQKLDFKLNND